MRVNNDRVDLATKLAYAVGGLCDSIKTFSLATFLLFYYTTVLGLPGSLLGLAMALGLLWDGAVDPLIGHLSDGAISRFGRRHSFMLVGAVSAGASLTAVFNPPPGLSVAALFAWLMISSLCLRTANSLFMVPYYALGAELSSDYHERTSISAYRAGAVLAGTLLAAAAAFVVFLPSGSMPGPDAKFAPGSYRIMGTAFGIATMATALVATLGTLRRRTRPDRAAASRRQRPRFTRALLDACRDRPFRVILAASSLAGVAGTFNSALSMHFLTYYVRLPANESMVWYFGGFYVGALGGVIAWNRVARTVEKSRLFAATTVAGAFVVSAGYWLIGEGRPLGTGHLPGLVVLTALAGFFGIAAAVIGPSMMADLTADDERRHGRRRDGTFFGVLLLGQQLSAGVGVLVAGVLVDRFAGLVPGQAQQSAVTIERLVLISNVLPAILLAFAGLIGSQFRLAGLDPIRPELRRDSRAEAV
jgi:GPH family glycoside/pentoside/hexuronide:cation symporter